MVHQQQQPAAIQCGETGRIVTLRRYDWLDWQYVRWRQQPAEKRILAVAKLRLCSNYADFRSIAVEAPCLRCEPKRAAEQHVPPDYNCTYVQQLWQLAASFAANKYLPARGDNCADFPGQSVD